MSKEASKCTGVVIRFEQFLFEFVFVLEFFDLKLMQVSTIFNQIFSRVINKYLEWLAQYNSPSATQKSLKKTV